MSSAIALCIVVCSCVCSWNLQVGANASAVSITERNSYLAHHTFKTVFVDDWLQCCLSCHMDEICISYNYNEFLGTCELNDAGLQEPFTGPEELVKSQGVVFHQIRPARMLLTPRSVQPYYQCDCSCASESACKPGLGSYERLPNSCKQIWDATSIRNDESFYIQAKSPGEYARVFCHMTPISGCGDGGWTLVMKIDGKKTTFTYNSQLWLNTLAYNEDAGVNLQKSETKLSSYWSTPFTKLCLGMKYNEEETRWISINYSGSSLYDVISTGSYQATSLNVNMWKYLITGSKLQASCTRQGFNSHDGLLGSAKARIGITGYPNKDCTGTAQSRIGFGTGGNFYGMDESNSCGNEHGPSMFRKKVFGYILVQ